jgi:hypothetical protein
MTKNPLSLNCTALTIFPLLILACAPIQKQAATVEPAETNCQTGSAAVLVEDGFLRTLCGCQLATEAPGTVFPNPSNLTCHLSPNTKTVFFYYSGTNLRHQIIPSGNNQFVASPLSDPTSNAPIRAHTVTFSSAGTYPFIDAYTGMRGEIIVP